MIEQRLRANGGSYLVLYGNSVVPPLESVVTRVFGCLLKSQSVIGINSLVLLFSFTPILASK